jgi:hypothetical protein
MVVMLVAYRFHAVEFDSLHTVYYFAHQVDAAVHTKANTTQCIACTDSTSKVSMRGCAVDTYSSIACSMVYLTACQACAQRFSMAARAAIRNIY